MSVSEDYMLEEFKVNLQTLSLLEQHPSLESDPEYGEVYLTIQENAWDEAEMVLDEDDAQVVQGYLAEWEAEDAYNYLDARGVL